MKNSKLFTFVLCSVCVFSLNTAFAKNLFISTSGNDNVSYANNNISHPWRTAEKAFSAVLRAGDNVYFRSGTYNMTRRIRQSSGGNGTAANPITFSNYRSESVSIRGSGNQSGMTGQIFIEKNYQHVDGITFHGHGTFFEIGWNYDATHFKATNCIFHNDTAGGGRNIGSIVFRNNRGRDAIIKNCKFYGPGEGVNINTAGVFIFRTQNVKILNCEFYNIANGIFYKHTCVGRNTGIEFAYNYFKNCHTGILNVAQYANIHDNIFNGSRYKSGLDGGTGDDGANIGGDHNTLNHNTFFNCPIQLVNFGGGGGPMHNTITNNVIMSKGQIYPYSSSAHHTSLNYNLYNSGDIFTNNRRGYNLGEWRSHNHSDANSLQGRPIFSGGTNPNSITGFALTSSSPGYKKGSDGRDLGANVRSVGVNSSSTPPPEDPNPPTPQQPGPVQGFRLGAVEQQLNNLTTECINYKNSHPEWIFCDDFESGKPLVSVGRYFEYKNANGDFILKSNVGVEDSKGMRVLWQQGEVDAGSLALGFGRNPSSYMNKNIHSDEDFKEIYYRMYLKNASGWEGNPYKLSRAAVVSDSDWSQAMIAHLWSSQNENNTLAIDPVSCVVNGTVQCNGWNDFNNLRWLGKKHGTTPLFSQGQAGQWRCIEAHVKLNDPGNNNGIHEFWIDGQLQARSSNLNFTDTYTEYGINYIAFENHWNSGSSQEQERYFDNIVVSTSPIGCQ